MKAITIYDPWATLAALKQKQYETRDWPIKYRVPIAIHAAKSTKPWHMDFCWDEPFYTALKERHAGGGITFYPGCIVAIGNLADCSKVVSTLRKDGKLTWVRLKNGQIIEGNELAFGDYTLGRYAWKLEDVHQLIVPIQTKGYQRIWNWDETPHLVTIDPFKCGRTKIWTPRGVISGSITESITEDVISGLEVIAK